MKLILVCSLLLLVIYLLQIQRSSQQQIRWVWETKKLPPPTQKRPRWSSPNNSFYEVGKFSTINHWSHLRASKKTGIVPAQYYLLEPCLMRRYLRCTILLLPFRFSCSGGCRHRHHHGRIPQTKSTTRRREERNTRARVRAQTYDKHTHRLLTYFIHPCIPTIICTCYLSCTGVFLVGRIFVFFRHINTISTQSKDFWGEKKGSSNSPIFWGKKFWNKICPIFRVSFSM